MHFLEYINKGKNGEIILAYGKEEIHCEFLEMYVVDGEEYAVGNGTALGAVGAELAVEQVAHVAHIAHGPRIIKTIFLVIPLDLLRSRRLADRLVGGIDGRERHQEEDQEAHA